MKLKVINQAKNLKGKRVLVRVDFNVPMKRAKILDDARIIASLPTIRFLEREKVKQIILVSHLGRPQGKVVKSLSLLPQTLELSRLLRHPVKLFNLSKAKGKLFNQERIVLLENIRFDRREEKNDKNFIKKLAILGDIFINDALSVSHRTAASVSGVARVLPSYAGLNLAHEVLFLDKVLQKPVKPLVVVIGGVKIEDKLPVINKLAIIASQVLVGGAVANTFLAAKGLLVGKSLVDKKFIPEARKILKKFSKKIILPKDVVVDVVGTKKKETKLISVFDVQKNYCLYDLGVSTVREYSSYLKHAKTVLWAGVLGKTEDKLYAHASLALGRLVSSKARGPALVVVAGGDTASFFHQYGLWVDYLSFAGGAALKFLAGDKLPGLAPLVQK